MTNTPRCHVCGDEALYEFSPRGTGVYIVSAPACGICARAVAAVEGYKLPPPRTLTCAHESDGLLYTSHPPQYKCAQCGVFYPAVASL